MHSGGRRDHRPLSEERSIAAGRRLDEAGVEIDGAPWLLARLRAQHGAVQALYGVRKGSKIVRVELAVQRE